MDPNLEAGRKRGYADGNLECRTGGKLVMDRLSARLKRTDELMM